ncbi:SAM dependent carboxyl methyltransferase [Dillenia turbinata]|uniref:SAM dependent carboxyl methyltransferase n=1 Tax=Dillenia turbinata TaxID=194707 RepID=A0AAN8ZBV0_9MAGN
MDMVGNDLLEVHPMNGREAPSSYSQNSLYQKRAVDAVKERIYEAISNEFDIKNKIFDPSTPFRVADLGCFIGPITLFAAENIIGAVESKYNAKQQELPEFQVLFSDHFHNDFNALFKSLPPSGNYFAAGVPGSFHNRLFPKSTINFVHTSNALNWLSKVPEEIKDRNSPAWNKDRIYCSGDNKEVAGAYYAQFKSDINDFLNARAQEIAEGGLLCIIIDGLPNGVKLCETGLGMLQDLLGSCLKDLAKEGVIDQERVESINFPTYIPTIGELEDLIEQNNNFCILSLGALHTLPLLASKETIAAIVGAVAEGVMKEHFGDEIIKKLFDLFLNKLPGIRHSLEDEKYQKNIEICIMLKLKSK